MAQGHWTHAEAEDVLRAWRDSGLSLKRFAREQGIASQRLYWWRQKLERARARPSTALVAVSVTPPPRGDPVTVVLRSGHMVRVAPGFDEDTLSRVVTLLGGA